ncbi:MAG TPA: aconitase family protein, partial [Polyangiaceae bacterium]
RFTIANMTAELGGLNGIFAADGTAAAWLRNRQLEDGPREEPASDGARYFRADADAPYVARHTINLDTLAPLVAKPFSPDNVVEVEALVGKPIDGCFIGACTTTEEELVLAALVLERAFAGRPARPASEKLLVVPGDLSIRARLEERGLWRYYRDAGFRVGPPGCSMCLGVASEKAQPGEVWLSSQNRNYENRMGPGSLAHLASAATVAAAALSMEIRDPRAYLSGIDQARYTKLLDRRTGRAPEIASTEPRLEIAPPANVELPRGLRPRAATGTRIPGRAQRFGDDIDTDAIIPGQFCHLTEPRELGAKAFHFVRPGFVDHVRAGRTFIVAGQGFGTGSSREQAVWALAGAGVRAVIARSFAFIHKRNLVNEALPFLEVQDAEFFDLTTEDAELELDLELGTIHHLSSGRLFRAEAPSPVVRALRSAGGLVAALEQHGKRAFEFLTE